MFGLDARIALAIFGALSVISGAALYSAIQQAGTTRQVASFEEVGKAIENYLLDTGSYLPNAGVGANSMYLGNVYSNYDSNSQWNGPYIGEDSLSQSKITLYIMSNSFLDTDLRAYRQAGTEWSGDISNNASSCSSSDCHIYLYYNASNANSTQLVSMNKFIDLYTRLDEYVDGSDGSRSGKVRYKDTGSSVSFYYQLMPVPY